jgi:hypothetical protein
MIPGITAQVGAGTSGTPTERWWRVRFAKNNGGNTAGNGSNAYIDVYKVQLFTTIGGAEQVATAIAFAAMPSYNVPTALIANDSGAIRWNNAGNQPLLEDCWVAFKLPVPDDIVRVDIRTGGTYGTQDVFIESSWDGKTWAFEYGYVRTGTGTISLDRQAIDWTTATYRDWLVQPQCIYNYTNLGVQEMEMASTIGGSDLCTGGTPRSTNNATYPAANLTDNNTGTLCGSVGQGRKAYVGYTFASAVNIAELRLFPHSTERPAWYALAVGLGTPGSFAGPWYVKQIFEGVEMGGVTATWTNLDARNPRIPASPAAGAHRYWRVRPASNNWQGGQAFSLSALDFKAGGTTLVGSGTAIAANWFSGSWLPSYAFDGNSATAWHSDNVNVRTWLGYDFGSAVLPDEIILTNRTDGASDAWRQQPVMFHLEYSDDGDNWFVKKGFTTIDPSAAGQTQTFLVT